MRASGARPEKQVPVDAAGTVSIRVGEGKERVRATVLAERINARAARPRKIVPRNSREAPGTEAAGRGSGAAGWCTGGVKPSVGLFFLPAGSVSVRSHGWQEPARGRGGLGAQPPQGGGKRPSAAGGERLELGRSPVTGCPWVPPRKPVPGDVRHLAAFSQLCSRWQDRSRAPRGALRHRWVSANGGGGGQPRRLFRCR